MHMLAGLSDSGDGDTYATAIRAARAPAEGGFRLPQLSTDSRRWLGGMWHTSTALVDGARRAVGGTVEILDGLLRPASTSLVGPVTKLRRYAAAEVSLEEVTLVCRHVRCDAQRCRIGGNHRCLPQPVDRPRRRNHNVVRYARWCPCRCAPTVTSARPTTACHLCCRTSQSRSPTPRTNCERCTAD